MTHQTVLRGTIKKAGSYLSILLLFASIMPSQAHSSVRHTPDYKDILGRWDITVDMDGTPRPSWLEIQYSGVHTLVGRYVGIVGSARPVSEIKFENGKISFTVPPQWLKKKGDVHVTGTYKDGHFEGTLAYEDGSSYQWTGRRAPALHRNKKPQWGKPIQLFDGKDISQWHATGNNQWKVENGVLKSPHSGANLVTNEKFKDFKLHIEVKYPKGSNSGIYLRGRYEVQVVDKNDKDPLDLLFGAIYGFLPPSELLTQPDQWQSVDITLIGRMVTVIINGKTVICHREIPGITGGALDSNEAAPGPILLQGDHGPIAYRNISILPAK